MRKYQKLFLSIVAVVSLVLFLIYRHHYNRLHHVLEVFNFFGTPCNFTKLQNSKEIQQEFDYGPLPLWQNIDDQRLIRNAFITDTDKIGGIIVIKANAALPKVCFVNYEDEIYSDKGQLSMDKIAEDSLSGIQAFLYVCRYTYKKRFPYSITIRPQSGQKLTSVLTTNSLKNQITLNATICTVMNSFSRKQFFEFISFHNMFNIDSYIIYYDQNIPYNVIKLLRNLSSVLNIWITFLPWNFPLATSDNFSQVLLEKDCYLRTNNITKYSIVLDINEYIVPLTDLTEQNHRSLNLPIKQFCLNNLKPNTPMILQNFESIDDYEFMKIRKLNKYIINDPSINENKTIANIFHNNCVIYKYQKCENTKIKTKTDYLMKMYSTDLTRSTLVQLLINSDSN